MKRTTFLCLFLSALAAACGDVFVEGASGHTTGGSSGATGGATTGGGGMCAAPPPPSPTPPDSPGCFTDMGSGWVQVPCMCELWLENAATSPGTAAVQLAMTPPDQAPALTGPLDVEIDFEDPDASWYATWTKQPGSGTAFLVTNANGTTTVRMGQGDIALAPAPLAACETRKANARVIGSDSAKLSMHAVLDDGTALATTDGTCFNPPHPAPSH